MYGISLDSGFKLIFAVPDNNFHKSKLPWNDNQRSSEIGDAGVLPPFGVSCADHVFRYWIAVKALAGFERNNWF